MDKAIQKHRWKLNAKDNTNFGRTELSRTNANNYNSIAAESMAELLLYIMGTSKNKVDTVIKDLNREKGPVEAAKFTKYDTVNSKS